MTDRPSGNRRAMPTWCLLAVLSMALGACSIDSIVGSAKLPAGITDPASMNTARGAIEAYRGTRVLFATAFSDHLATSALLSDEEAAGTIGERINPGRSPVDQRILPEGASATETDQAYIDLARVRGQAQQALGLLSAYAADSMQLRAHVLALEGYAEVLLNELFCSGVPLSTLDVDANFTYQPGSSTQDVYRHAIALFDSALVLAGDAGQVASLARVGKARALLGLGELAQAAQVAALVPDAFTYAVQLPELEEPMRSITVYNSVGDREGLNGLDYVTGGDPRSATQQSGNLYHPLKYAPDGRTPMVVADWVEARLIQAEAALQAAPDDTASQGTGWLGILNHLRETAITPALPDTADPGSFDARIDLLFRERALWLFLTGHRLGDLRRLIRQYGRDQSTVFPVGPYDAGSGTFGTDVNAPIPPDERKYNPRFTGCMGRGA